MKVTDDELAAWILGTPDGDVADRVGCRLATDPEFARRVAELTETLDAIAAPLGEERTASSLERLMEEVAQTPRLGWLAPTVADLLGIDEATASRSLARLDDPGAWGEGPLPGTAIQLEPVPAPDAAALWLRMPAGMRFPDHEHLGDETVLVVQGRYIDDDGRCHLPGTVLAATAEDHHGFWTDPEGPEFICLAVVHHGLRIEGRVLGPRDVYG